MFVLLFDMPIGENLKIAKALAQADIQSRFITDFSRQEPIVDTPMHSFEGYVADLLCNNIEQIFNNEDHGFIFKNNNLWLFIDNIVDRSIPDAIVIMPMYLHSSCAHIPITIAHEKNSNNSNNNNCVWNFRNGMNRYSMNLMRWP